MKSFLPLLLVVLLAAGCREKSAEIRQRSGLKHKSKGMAITQKRLEILNKSSKDEANVKITDLKDGQNNSLGTRVEILIIYKEV